MSSATESFDVTVADGRVMRITIDRRELASTMVWRLHKPRRTAKGYVKPKFVKALEGGIKAEWVAS